MPYRRAVSIMVAAGLLAAACAGGNDRAASQGPGPGVAADAPGPTSPEVPAAPPQEPPVAVEPPPEPGPPPQPPWNGGTPPPGMKVHREVGAVTGVGVDAGANVWAVDGSDGIWILTPGGSWRRYTGVGQILRGEPAITVCGADAGKAYVGYYVDGLQDPLHATVEQRAEGDVDRFTLDDAGNLSLEFHYEFHNNNGINADGTIKDKKTFDETRAILSCVRVNEGPFEGEVYFGSNHGLTRVRGDEFGDHRHPDFDYPPCPTPPDGAFECDDAPQAIGFVWGLGLTDAGTVLMSTEWTFAEVAPSDPALEPDLVRWTLNSHPWVLRGPPAFPLPGKTAPAWAPPWYARWPLRFAEPARNRAMAKTADERYWVASERHGLVWFDASGGRLKPYVEVEGEPGTITSLVANPDGSLWVGTDGAGVWRYLPQPRPAALADPPAPEAGTWTRLEGLPGGNVAQLYMETRSGKRQLYVATNAGLAVFTE